MWTYGVLVADLSSEFYRTGDCQPEDNVAKNGLRTNADGTTSNDYHVLRGFKALLPLGHELTNVRIALWVVDRTGPLGSSRQHKDCRTGKRLDYCYHHSRDRRTFIWQSFAPNQLKLAALAIALGDDLLYFALLDGSLPGWEELVVVEGVVVHGPLLAGDGQTRTSEHPDEVRASLHDDEVVLGVVEFIRELLGYLGTGETAADDDHVLLGR